jgi:hypothetical protein
VVALRALTAIIRKDQLGYLRKVSHTLFDEQLLTELEAEVASFFPTGFSLLCIGCIGFLGYTHFQ